MVQQNEMPRNPERPTSFLTIYDAFFTYITDDMYMELTEEDTYPMLQNIESNNKEVAAYGWIGGTFNIELTIEEINIIALNMVIGWLGQQLDTTENTREKYSGTDFKFTSQANHMAKLKVVIDAHKTDSLHLQRLYKRRIRTADGKIQSTIGKIVSKPTYGFKI